MLDNPKDIITHLRSRRWLLKRAEVCQITGWHKETFYKKRKKGTFRAIKLEGQWRVDSWDLADCLEPRRSIGYQETTPARKRKSRLLSEQVQTEHVLEAADALARAVANNETEDKLKALAQQFLSIVRKAS